MSLAKLLLRLMCWALAMNLLSTPLLAEELLDFKDDNFANTLFQTKQAEVATFPLDASNTANLQLEQFQLYAPDARIVVKTAQDTQTLPLPKTRYFKGNAIDQTNSAAFVAVDPDGKTRSVVQVEGQIYVHNSAEQKSAAPTARVLKPASDFKQQTFSCGVDGTTAFKPPLPAGIKAKLQTTEHAEAATDQAYTADLMIETDYEFYSQFNNATEAAQYVSDLIAYVSSLYEAEINTQLRLAQVVLYTSPNDPWLAENTSSALYEVQSYYLANHAQTKRTTVHFLSGKEMNGGIAFISSICTAPAYGGSSQGSYDFGVSGGISGSFTPNSPLIVWDAYVVAHELGHNFGSSHTHNYDVDHGYSLPIDCCYSQSSGACQNYQRGSELPGIGTLTGGTTATHPGTIMSYCHLVSGGSQNLAMTFGSNHPYGVEAYRVPQQMRHLVEAAAASYPQCLPAATTVSHPSPTFNSLSKWHESFVANTSTPLIGDFNGDQLDDVASFAQYSSHKVFVALSTGNALATKTLWKTNFALGTEQAAVGDFNGDGKTDLVSLTHNEKRQIYVALSTGSSFAANTLWFGLKTAEDGTQVIGDFDGDGKDDVATIQLNTGMIFMNTSTGDRFRVQRQWSSDAALNAQQIVVGDFNGDHKADLGFGMSTGEFKVSLSSGTAFAPTSLWHSTLAAGVTQLVAGDFNADGKDDIASYVQTEAGGIYLALAENGQFSSSQKVHSWLAPYDQIIKAGYFTDDKLSDIIGFTRGKTADVWVGTNLP